MSPHFPRGLAHVLEGELRSPFARLRQLLADVEPGRDPIDLSLGEPREPVPAFVAERVRQAEAAFGRYPSIRGTDGLREAIAGWLDRRHAPRNGVDPATEVLPVSGSREGLCSVVLVAAARKRVPRPALLVPNPGYAAYVGAALAAGLEPVFLDATEATGHLPDLDALSDDVELLRRTVGLVVCTPANPQGAVADRTQLERAIALARHHDFVLLVDECYSEIYVEAPPVGALTVAAATPERFRNLIVLNSLSKRSGLPGLRSGLCAGDAELVRGLAEVRNVIGPQMPEPIQQASAAAWADEEHVERIRAAHRARLASCDELLGGRLGYCRPAGGFFLWLDVSTLGGAEEAARELWRSHGLKVLPGTYLTQRRVTGEDPGAGRVRVALVHELAVIRMALERIVAAAG